MLALGDRDALMVCSGCFIVFFCALFLFLLYLYKTLGLCFFRFVFSSIIAHYCSPMLLLLCFDSVLADDCLCGFGDMCVLFWGLYSYVFCLCMVPRGFAFPPVFSICF